ncbi:protein argonaute 14-like [Phacochoerus africanus]|uniref:protein argonaute 14-like n=1 Tax=Phacochoerus africanus TaxID=41426 RepID=UPI001FD8E298|nr:protein argonaute 14-like [Phacochoerus africanus]
MKGLFCSKAAKDYVITQGTREEGLHGDSSLGAKARQGEGLGPVRARVLVQVARRRVRARRGGELAGRRRAGWWAGRAASCGQPGARGGLGGGEYCPRPLASLLLSRRLVGPGSLRGEGDDLGEYGRGGAGSGWRLRGGSGGQSVRPGAGSLAAATPAPRRPRGPRRRAPPRAPAASAPSFGGGGGGSPSSSAPPRGGKVGTWLRETPPGAAGRLLGKVEPRVVNAVRLGQEGLPLLLLSVRDSHLQTGEDLEQPGQQRQDETLRLFAHFALRYLPKLEPLL